MAGKIRAHHGESSTGSAVRAGQTDFQAGSRRSTDRLPPGQHLTQGFPVLDLGIKPEIALADWRLEIGGVVENPANALATIIAALKGPDGRIRIPGFYDAADFDDVVTRIGLLASAFDACATPSLALDPILDLLIAPEQPPLVCRGRPTSHGRAPPLL